MHLQHGGKLSLARLLAGHLDDGATLHSSSGEAGRVSGILAVSGAQDTKRAVGGGRRDDRARQARRRQDRRYAVERQDRAAVAGQDRAVAACAGDVAFGRATARTTSSSARRCSAQRGRPLARRSSTTRTPTTSCCGDRARCICASRSSGCKDRFGVNVKSHPPAIGYRETIRKSVTQRGRHKKQSGGHGQFGDVVLEIKPMPRGARLRVPREGCRRRGAAQLYRRGGGGRGRRAGARSRSASR